MEIIQITTIIIIPEPIIYKDGSFRPYTYLERSEYINDDNYIKISGYCKLIDGHTVIYQKNDNKWFCLVKNENAELVYVECDTPKCELEYQKITDQNRSIKSYLK